MVMQRGEIWWAELRPEAGKRPVVLLSRDEAYVIRELVTVAPVATRIRHIPSEVPLSLEDGLPKPCVINLDNITTIAKSSLLEKLSVLSVEKKKSVELAIHFVFGFKS
jgi:mRNA interferase MazF